MVEFTNIDRTQGGSGIGSIALFLSEWDLWEWMEGRGEDLRYKGDARVSFKFK